MRPSGLVVMYIDIYPFTQKIIPTDQESLCAFCGIRIFCLVDLTSNKRIAGEFDGFSFHATSAKPNIFWSAWQRV